MHAMRDDWPCRVLNGPELLEVLRREDRHPVATSPQGLLWLLADALSAPWVYEGPVRSIGFLQDRIARLAMVAADGLDAPAGEAEGRRAAELLLGIGRLNESDDLAQWVTRCGELYGELLPRRFPLVRPVFERARGRSVDAWLIAAALTYFRCAQGARPGTTEVARLEVGGFSPEVSGVRAVARSLSRTRAEFSDRFSALRAAGGADPSLAFQPLRETPLLRLDADTFVVLHTDFLLAAMGRWDVVCDARRT